MICLPAAAAAAAETMNLIAQGSQPTYSYILAPQDLAAGDVIASGAGVPIKPGNTLPLK